MIIFPALIEFVTDQVSATLGVKAATVRVETARRGAAGWVILVRITDGRRIVVKSDDVSDAAHFERTAAVIATAGGAGVPVPRVLSADDSGRAGPWAFLILEYVDGLPWRELRPRLSTGEAHAAHKQIGAAIAALHTVRFGSFGELDSRLQPTGDTLLAALRLRAELRIADRERRMIFDLALARHEQVFDPLVEPTLCHDDLHHENVVFRRGGSGWELAAILDWDKAWAGPAESDCARVAFWDDMTGPGFWAAYPGARPRSAEQRTRAEMFQLLWCLEYDDPSPRHAADTARLRFRLDV